ncbi:primosome assembly protein PriA, partial [Streptomyces sp. SID10244]|nr:primosome assembly protein PriA [Streptomyces sp. SID10244]
PDGAERLGPVPLPAGVRAPAGSGDHFDGDVERILLRVDRRDGKGLAAALVAAQVRRNANHDTGPIRVQVDPPTIG